MFGDAIKRLEYAVKQRPEAFVDQAGEPTRAYWALFETIYVMLHAIGEESSMAAHMSQHLILGDIVPLRVGAGDNANCFNLNSTLQPRLLAVDAAKLTGRGGADWSVLRGATGRAIPALVDETTLMWALKRKVGDVLPYVDEVGRAFDVRLAGVLRDSICLGHLSVDEARFLERFPSNPGYSLFLAEAKDPAGVRTLRDRLAAAAADAGGRVELTRDVLAAFHQIENTYIAILNVLGSLGVILGSLGLAIVVARNLRERRGEFAVMAAIGIPGRVLARMVFSEFGRLIAWGLAIGAAASVIAVWPGVTTLPPAPTVALVTAMLAGIGVLNLACGWAIFRWSLRELRPGVALAAT